MMEGVVLKEFWEILPTRKGRLETEYVEATRLIGTLRRTLHETGSIDAAWRDSEPVLEKLESLGVRIDRKSFEHLDHLA
jgi:hypothetical protein